MHNLRPVYGLNDKYQTLNKDDGIIKLTFCGMRDFMS